MPNLNTGTQSAGAPSMAGVGTVSEIIVPANNNRTGLIITNIADSTIYLGIEKTATLKAGIVLIPGGGAFSMDEYSYNNGAITAISTSGTLVVAFQEFIRYQ